MARQGRLSTFACMALMFVAAFALFRPALAPGRVMMPTELFGRMPGWQKYAEPGDGRTFVVFLDQLQAMYPYKEYHRASLLEGRVPLWNPHQAAGTPFAATPQSGVFYAPSTFLLLAMPTAQYLGMNAFFHCFLAGVTMFLLLRAMGCGRGAALAGGAGYMLCGWMTVWTTFEGFHSAAAWAPLAVMFYELAVSRPGARFSKAVYHAALGGSVLGVMVLAGGVQVAAYTGLVCALFGAGAVMSGGSDAGFSERAARVCAVTAVTAAAGFAVGAVQALPSLELARESVRTAAGLPAREAAAGVLAYFVPDALGNPVTGSFRGYPPMFVEGPVYCGAAVAALAACAVLLISDRRRGALLVAAALGVSGALALPFMKVFAALPVAGMMKMSRMSFLVSFAAPALAGLAVESAARGGSRLRYSNTARAIAGCALLAVCGAAMWNSFGGSPGFAAGARAAAGAVCAVAVVALASRRPVAAGVLAAVVFAVDLLLWGSPVIPSGRAEHAFPAPGAIEKILSDKGLYRVQGLHGIMKPDMAMAYGLRDVRGYDPLGLRDYAALVGEMNRPLGIGSMSGAVMVPAAYDHPAMDALGVRYVMSMSPLDESRFERVYDDGMYVYRNPRALGRAVFYTKWRVAADAADAARVVAAGRFDPRREVVLEKSPGVPEGEGAGSARVLKYSPESIEVETDSTTAGVLFVSEVWEKNWRAEVDGRPVEMLRADRAFRAVEVGAGKHVVRMEYAPGSLAAGFAVSGAGVVVMMIFGAAICRGRVARG